MSFRTTSAHALPWYLLQIARLEAIKWCVVVAVVLCCVDTIGRSDIPAVAYCSWSFCNYAAASLGYPTFTTRMADCPGQVTDADNALMPPQVIPGYGDPSDVNTYAIFKEAYLGDVCGKPSQGPTPGNWSHWSVMFKSGNMDPVENLCNSTAPGLAGSMDVAPRPLQFDNLPMNQPLVVHNASAPGWALPYTNATGVSGYFAGTYDVPKGADASVLAALSEALHQYQLALYAFRLQELASAESGHVGEPPKPPPAPQLLVNASFLSVQWYKNVSSNSWVFYNTMNTSPKYPWLMNYLRANDVSGGYGGYPFAQGRGLMFGPVTSAAQVDVRLNILNPGAPSNQFYLPEISGCWKLDGSPCDGDVETDITRYLCFITNPTVKAACSATSQTTCPPYHARFDGSVVWRNDTANFPYSCYHLYCSPPGAPQFPGFPTGTCDPFSNPNPQELQQVLPCAEWAPHGFPSVPGQGWVGDDRLWHLDAGGLAARLFLTGTEPALRGAPPMTAPGSQGVAAWPGLGRTWVSFEVGPEQYGLSSEMVRWEVSEWDVQL